MRTPELLKNATVLLGSVALSVVAAEAGIRLFAGWDLFVDRRSDAYWIELSVASSKPADPADGGDIVPDETLGWRMKPMLARDGVRHNSIGFRGDTEYAQNAAGLRILAIGDSFTYGLGVRDEETFAAHLNRPARVEVINAGVNAYGVDQALLMWEKEGRRFSPHVVVLGYYVDDFYRNLLAVRDKPKPRFAFDPASRQFEFQNTAASRDYADRQRREGGAFSQWHVHQAATWLWRKALGKLGSVDDKMVEGARLSEFLLARLNDSVTRSGAKLVVAFIGDHFGGNAEHAWIEASVARSCRSLAITCVNLAAAMRQVDAGQFYGPNHHFSAVGHRFAAEQIAQAIGPVP